MKKLKRCFAFVLTILFAVLIAALTGLVGFAASVSTTAPTVAIPGYQRVTALASGEQYLIVTQYNGSYYFMTGGIESSSANRGGDAVYTATTIATASIPATYLFTASGVTTNSVTLRSSSGNYINPVRGSLMRPAENSTNYSNNSGSFRLYKTTYYMLYNNSGYFNSNTSTAATCYCSFYKPLSECTSVAITGVTAPVSEANVSAATAGIEADGSGFNISVSDVQWSYQHADSPAAENNSQFGYGTAYTLTVSLTDNDGDFSSELAATLNGAATVVSDISGNTAKVSYTFPATGIYWVYFDTDMYNYDAIWDTTNYRYAVGMNDYAIKEMKTGINPATGNTWEADGIYGLLFGDDSHFAYHDYDISTNTFASTLTSTGSVSSAYGYHNIYTGWQSGWGGSVTMNTDYFGTTVSTGGYPFQGIAQQTLGEDGAIKFNVPDGGLFTDEEISGVKQVYKDVGLPFRYDSSTAYYSLDASEYDVYFPNYTPTSNVDMTHTDLLNTFTTSNGASYQGYFPFYDGTTAGLGSEKKVAGGTLDYFFGMHFSFNFFMTEDGKDEYGQDMRYHFSGDDDVWIYVDGKLVLDIGGNHDEIDAEINFSTDTVTIYNGTATSDTPFATYSLSRLLGYDIREQSITTKHTIDMFYLERGASQSNLEISFNLLLREMVEAEKDIVMADGHTPTFCELDYLNQQSYSYRISYKTPLMSENDSAVAYANKIYGVYEGLTWIRDDITDDNGAFTLKYNQKACFVEPAPGYSFFIQEHQNADIRTISWSISTNSVVTEIYDTSSGPIPINESDSLTGQPDDSDNIYSAVCHNLLKPKINPTVVVADYGKSINTYPLDNDLYLGFDNGIAAVTPILSASAADAYSGSDSAVVLDNGNASILSDGKIVRYTPTKYMSSIDRFNYYVDVNYTDPQTEVTYSERLHSTVSVIPATTVYYEDNFSTGSGTYITYTGNWSTAVDPSGAASDSLQDRGEIAMGNTPYGYDSSYNDDTYFSNGSANVVEGSVTFSTDESGNRVTEFNASAAFLFTGTGFDIVSRTDIDCGYIAVYVERRSSDTGEYEFVTNVPVLNKGVNNLYQIPVISITGLPYGDYRVTINVAGPSALFSTGSTFYLDAIRIFEPMGISQEDNSEFSEAYDAYCNDYEGDPTVISMRDIIISAEDLGVSFGSGVVWVDTLDDSYNSSGLLEHLDETDEQGNTVTGADLNLTDYTGIGPNEEVYLTYGAAIGFRLETPVLPDTVQISCKAPYGETSLRVQTFGYTASTAYLKKSVTSATEMYYDITDYIHFLYDSATGTYYAIVIISNGGVDSASADVLSLVNLKLAYGPLESDFVQPETVQANLQVAAMTYSMVTNAFNAETAACILYDARLNSENCKAGDTVTLNVTTSQYAERIELRSTDGQIINPDSSTFVLYNEAIKGDNNAAAKTWTLTFAALQGEQTVEVYAFDDANEKTEPLYSTYFGAEPTDNGTVGETEAFDNSDLFFRRLWQIINTFFEKIKSFFASFAQ